MNNAKVKNILAPVDLGHSSEAALQQAALIAERTGARLTLMYVNDALTLQSYDEIYTGYRNLPDEQEMMMEDAVRDWARPIVKDLWYDVLVIADDTPRGIATAAARRNADIIVMGTHARSGWNRMISGSIAESVLHHTDRPVITVPQEAKAGISTIVCPVTFSEAGRDGARTACCMSQQFGAKLHLVHVADHNDRDPEARLRQWLGASMPMECTVDQIVVRGNAAADRAVDYAKSISADIMIVGAQQKPSGGTRSTIGTTTERILRVSPIPVMSVIRQHVPFLPEVVEVERELAHV